MLQWMHRISTSWVASLFMGALALSFVVWGIADVFTGMGGTALATVDSTEIGTDAFQRSYRNFLKAEGQRMGSDISPDMAQKMGLPNVVLQQLVGRQGVTNAADRMHLTIPQATLVSYVHSQPVFMAGNGQFDYGTFQHAIGVELPAFPVIG